MTSLPLAMPSRSCDEQLTPAALTYDAIKFLRLSGYEVRRVSDEQHRVRGRGQHDFTLLDTHELKAYAKRIGWRAGRRL